MEVVFWYEPKDDEEVNVEAARRGLEFVVGWPLDPIFANGDYPETVKTTVELPCLILK